MTINYIYFPINRQKVLTQGVTQTVDSYHQLHGIIWFYLIILLGLIIVLSIGIYFQTLMSFLKPTPPSPNPHYYLSLVYKLLIKVYRGLVFYFLTVSKKVSKPPHALKSRSNPYIVYENWVLEAAMLTLPVIFVFLMIAPAIAES